MTNLYSNRWEFDTPYGTLTVVQDQNGASQRHTSFIGNTKLSYHGTVEDEFVDEADMELECDVKALVLPFQLSYCGVMNCQDGLEADTKITNVAISLNVDDGTVDRFVKKHAKILEWAMIKETHTQ
jgi:hypothetical protein